MKYIDKFLKFLKTDRNTFATYILSIITIYLVVDRIVELLMLAFTGISISYWGPIQYTFALACPVFAFLFSGSSKFTKSDDIKLAFMYLYCTALYIIGISMAVQWINALLWLLFLSLPNYAEIVSTFPELVQPAFQAIAVYLPLTTFYPLFKWLLTVVNDTKDIRDSIADYGGIDLSNKKEGTGPYTCEMPLGVGKETGKVIKIPESRRYESTLVVGVSGSGKTSMMFEPMMARDLERKFFFQEASKELGFTALKTRLATLNCPYSNEYINENFTLNMITPVSGKEKLYKAYLHKLILGEDKGNLVYRNIGLTSVSPDYESTSHILEVARNFNFKVNLIDPANPDSPGLNPFIYEDPTQTAIAISSVLKGMYNTTHVDTELAFYENVAAQAIENLSILLKEMYPRLHEGLLPNLEDLMHMLTDFNLVEEMCKQMQDIPELAEKYEFLIAYFKKNFYANGLGKENTEKYVCSATTELDNLLRYSGVRNILCNRSNNIDYDKALANGEITLICTRRGDLGSTAHKAFGLFFLLLMQYSVLRRPGNEKNRIPHFLYIDEFPDFICKSTESIFTLYRKYRVGTIISAQNLSQLGVHSESKARQTILANCTTKVVFGNNTPEDNQWWQIELGEKREWKYTNDYKTDKGSYDPTYKSISWAYKENYKAGKVQSLKFKQCILKTKDLKGKNIVEAAKVDFLESKYKEPHKVKFYDFANFTNGISNDSTNNKKPSSNSIQSSDFEDNPIQTDYSDSKFLFDNENAIVFDIKKNNN